MPRARTVHVHARPNLGIAIHRVAKALADFAPPWVQVVPHDVDAEFTVVHMLGDGERKPWQEAADKSFAVVQYMVRTTETPYTRDWEALWSKAACVWSYYDLAAHVAQDLAAGVGPTRPTAFNIYYAPLGVDPTIFRPCACPERYLIGTSGYIASTESVEECARAVGSQQGRMFHLGPHVLPDAYAHYVDYGQGLTDREVAKAWGSCRYVSGLRRIEGFELPAAEALLCGSRPLLFDQPHYRHWFGDWAAYVPESDPDTTTRAIIEVLKQPVRPVTLEERRAAIALFSWPLLVQEFWSRVAAALPD